MTLEIFWFCLIAVLWTGYLVLEGFDFGVGMLLWPLSRDALDRRVMINTIGPVWDGNEVWLLVAGGATFAAFPNWYATLFSGAYLALFAILVALILRGVAFEWRGKGHGERWARFWDGAILFGSVVPPLVWGVAFAAIMQGVPIGRDGTYVGAIGDFLTPYTLLGGIMLAAVCALNGALYLTMKTTGALRARAERTARLLAIPTAVLLVGFLAATAAIVEGSTSAIPPIAALAAAALVGAGAIVLIALRRYAAAFAAVAATIALTVAAIFCELFPRVMVSSLHASWSLTIADAASTHYTLSVMSVVALVMTPVVLLYQGWTYYVFRHRISRDDLGPLKSPVELLGSKAAADGAHAGD